MPGSIQPAEAQRNAQETLLCIHPSATSGRMWAPLVATLAARFEVLAPDRLGCAPGSRWCAGTPATLAAEARHLEALIVARPEGVHILAHSYGGAVALELAQRCPHQVRSLTLYEPSRFALLFDATDAAADCNEIARLGRTVVWLVMSGRLADAAAMFIDYWSGDGAWRGMGRELQQATAARMPKVAAELDAALTDPAPLKHLDRLEMAVCLINGSESPSPVRRICDLLGRALPHAQRVELHGVGHMGPCTHTERVVASLPTWLSVAPLRLAA